jgi:transcriptional regulator with XRE-family HTH domain
LTPTEKEALTALGCRVRVLRAWRGLSQTQLAEAAGLERMSIVSVETARRAPSFITLWRVAHGLSVPLAELLSDPDRPVPGPARKGSQVNGMDQSDEATASAVVPLNLLDTAAELVAEFTGGRVVADFVERRFGRLVTARLVSYEVIQRIHHAPGQGLDTAGPVLAREVVLVNKEPPHLPLAFCTALVVPNRLPAEVASALTTDADAVDRLLTRHAVDWHAELRPEEGFIGPFE